MRNRERFAVRLLRHFRGDKRQAYFFPLVVGSCALPDTIWESDKMEHSHRFNIDSSSYGVHFACPGSGNCVCQYSSYLPIPEMVLESFFALEVETQPMDAFPRLHELTPESRLQTWSEDCEN